MKKIISKSFKREILLCVVTVALLPLLISSSFLIQVFKSTLARDDAKRAAEQLEKVEVTITTLLEEFDHIATELSHDTVVIEGIAEDDSWVKNRIYTKLYLQTNGMRDKAQFSIYDAEGICHFSTGKVIDERMPTYWGAMKVAKAHVDEMVIRNASEYNNAEELALQSVRGIFNQKDECVGYIVISMSRDNFTNLLANIVEAQSGITIIDSFWEEMYSTEIAQKENLAQILRSRRMQGENITQKLDQMNIFMRQIGDTGVYIVLSRTPVFTKAITGQMYSIMLIMVAISLLLCFILADAMSNNLSLPIRNLSSAMQAVQKGDLEIRVEANRNDEIGLLSKHFNKMTKELKKYMELQVRQQKEVNDANISMMQAQLNPHFLYNTLDTMKWVAKTNHIQEMATLATGLGKILRTSISDNKFITLEQELALVECYTDIQQIRFSGNFTFDMEVPVELEECMVPKLIVQPIVENAIIHGLAECESGHIFLNAYEQEKVLFIEISDDGCGMKPEILKQLNSRDSEKGKGHLGFYNVDTIIRLYYGERYGVHAQNLEGGGTKVIITLPSQRR